ncbi:alpha/beta fold hydrolase [Nonomuraea sp. NPDC003709]|uniref:alpha/beta fold hydrolase n=1 Tax=Nonomuraea sp. NPDC003709 TaxID=3154450 RepID=UPI0033B1101D
MVRLDGRSPASGHRPQRKRLCRWLLSAIAVLVALLLFGAYGWQPAQAEFRSPYLDMMGSKYADTAVARFHYIRAGSGSPVILISPGGTSVIGWKDQVSVLARDHTVYVVDLPGQGYTRLKDPGFGYDLAAMTTALGAFMDAVGVRQAGLAGNSWSGGWALAFTQRHPDRVSKLALLDATGLDLPGTWMWEALKIPVVGELATTHLGRSLPEPAIAPGTGSSRCQGCGTSGSERSAERATTSRRRARPTRESRTDSHTNPRPTRPGLTAL